MSQNQNYWWNTFKIFLSTGSRDICNDNLIQPPAQHSQGLGRGAKKGPEWAQNDQKLGKYVPKPDFEPMQAFFEPRDQIFIEYVSRACTKKNLESIPPMILLLGHIFLYLGHFEPIQALFEPP